MAADYTFVHDQSRCVQCGLCVAFCPQYCLEMGEDGYPYGVPMNYYYDKDDEKIYMHCAKAGHKVDALSANEKVCFTVFNKGEKPDDDWAYFVTSVIAFGKAAFLTDMDVIRTKAKAFGMKYYPTEEEVDEEIRKDLSRANIIAITIDHMTGKRVHEK